MMPAPQRRPRLPNLLRWAPTLVILLAWSLLLATAIAVQGQLVPSLLIGFVGAAALLVILAAQRWAESLRWARPIENLASELNEQAEDARLTLDLAYVPELASVLKAIRALQKSWQRMPSSSTPTPYHIGMDSGNHPIQPAMTRSELLAAIPASEGSDTDSARFGDFGTTDMVSRLDPKTFRWRESSRAEQEFLGWDLEQLRAKSFLEVVYADDVPKARAQFRTALDKGEIHGLLLRIRTAEGKLKWIEMNVGVRYGADAAIIHLRCHLADVTAKISAERNLKLRTRELTQVNEQLRQINRELEELKDRYRDLYQNAPAMYYSVDEQHRLIECNDTMLRTLGYRREELVGRSYERLLPEARRAAFATRMAEFLRRGSFEGDTQWIKAGGEVIDVWVSGTAVRGREGEFLHSRSVAQDVTARHRLEAELQEKNDRLARTNDELSRKNKEMDEFTYVVSHDLQEPLRTLIAFSDFLLRDCGDRLDANGQEYVRYIVDASRRMRALINGLLNLSRAGRVTGDFSPVILEDVVAVVRADLRELIRTKGAEVHVAGPLPTIWGDRDRIGQLIANLVTNGLKYNKKDAPRVEVGALPDDATAWVTIYVRDNGIGIEPQFHAKIFQLFRRLHTREEYEGTGAGLAICSKIVQAHGGRIWVESQPDEGATFFVTLRRSPSERPASQTHVTHAH